MRWRRRPAVLRAALLTAAVILLGACSVGSADASAGPAGSPLPVVAAENVWGSIAGQLGGRHVRVTSIIDKPDVDPHDYEPTPADARRIASARYVIVNGIGYDPWAEKLLAADPTAGRAVLNVGHLVGVKDGGNPHRWYSPADVIRVVDQITADLKRLDPKDSSSFESQRTTFVSNGLNRYNSLVADIRARYAGTPVGASESMFALLAPSLGLDLLTPDSFLNAVSEGTEPTSAAKSAADAEIRSHDIKVYVFNSQNATPDVQAQVDAAKAAGIPTTTITETLTPSTASFQQWQVAQLQALQAALDQATGR